MNKGLDPTQAPTAASAYYYVGIFKLQMLQMITSNIHNTL